MKGQGHSGRRLCPSCGRPEPMDNADLVWPAGWTCKYCRYSVEEIAGIATLAPELADTISGFDPRSFHALSEVEASHFWFVARILLINRLAAKYFPQARDYLEVGCGNGAVIASMARSRPWRRIVGTELHPTGLSYARGNLPRSVELVQMDARRIPADRAFDLIGAFDVIEHIAEDELVLAAMHRATRRGGGAIVTVPQHPWLWSAADDVAYHQRRYGLGEMERKMVAAGYEILFSSSYTALLFPLMVISRLKSRLIPAKDQADINREFEIAPALNAAMTWLLRAEIALTLRGLRWPVGGSRILVAKAM